MSNTKTNKLPAALREISIPRHVIVDIKPSYDDLMRDLMRRSVGFDGITLHGCAYLQGGRLMFISGMPIPKMLDVSDQDRAKKGANVAEVLEHSNRAKEPGHEKNIKDYLRTTACIGEKFVLPPFMFNFGVKAHDDVPDVTLILLDQGQDGAKTWAAVLLLPQGARLDTTDGVHRRNSVLDMKNDRRMDPDSLQMLMANSVGVVIIFEQSQRDSHQDFADCGRAKTIAKSTVAAYDSRNARNRLATEFATTHPFLYEYVDGSANNVNLTGKSHRIWSLSAVRTMVDHVIKHHPQPEAADEVKTAELPKLFNAVIKELPQLKALEAHRLKNPRPDSITGAMREFKGGDVALRYIGLVLFARAYLHCFEHGMSFEEMAQKLAGIDWHVLDCDRDQLPETDDPDAYHRAVIDHSNPLWRPLLVVKAKRYKISSSTDDANLAWDAIARSVLPAVQQAAE